MIMKTVKAKDLKGGMIIELPDIAPGFKPGLVTITQIEFEAPHIVEVSFLSQCPIHGGSVSS